jgi:hypothetical protein
MHGPCVAIDEPLARYRRHAGNVSQGPDATRLGFEEGLQVTALAATRHPQLAAPARGMRCALLLGAARRAWRAGRRSEALRYTGRALRSGGAPRLARTLAAGYRRRRSAANSS